jgi:hypothetical protein
MWADMGDYLSMQNAGTPSTISRVSRDGKEGFLGKINHKVMNVRRYLVNSLNESSQQTAIDLILGTHPETKSSSYMENYLKHEMKVRRDQYTAVEKIRVQVNTWNLGGVKNYE